MEAAAWAAEVGGAVAAIVVVFIVVVVVVVAVAVVVVVVAVAGVGVVGVVVVATGELAYWTKVGEAVSPVGLCPCPSPVVRDSDPSP